MKLVKPDAAHTNRYHGNVEPYSAPVKTEPIFAGKLELARVILLAGRSLSRQMNASVPDVAISAFILDYLHL